PPESVTVPLRVTKSSTTWPNAVLLPGPGGERIKSVSDDGAPAAFAYTTLEPTPICFTFEDVIVQNEPASPVYSEHSFVTWRAPLRREFSPSLSSPAFRELETAALTIEAVASLPFQPPATSNANT